MQVTLNRRGQSSSKRPRRRPKTHPCMPRSPSLPNKTWSKGTRRTIHRRSRKRAECRARIGSSASIVGRRWSTRGASATRALRRKRTAKRTMGSRNRCGSEHDLVRTGRCSLGASSRLSSNQQRLSTGNRPTSLVSR